MPIHSSAIVSSHAEIESAVDIGPYAVIEDHVIIGEGSSIGAGSVVRSYTRLGKNNRIDAHAILGGEPQDISFKGQETWLEIGDDNIIREYTSIHRATRLEKPTRIGNRNYIMCNSHIGHDCTIGHDVIITSYSGISGHVCIDDHAVIGGSVGIHQFCRIGSFAMVAGFTPLRKDVLPYTMVGGEPVRHYRLNTIGLRRAGITGERYRALEQVFRQLRQGVHSEFHATTDELKLLQNWIQAPSRRGIYGFLHG